MKIVEKKCPNCGANLDFKVGERDVTCAHCRRKYAIQYDGTDFSRLGEEAVKALKDIDINLKPFRNVVMIIAGVFIGIAVLFMVFFAIFAFKSSSDFNKRVEQNQQEYERRVQESQQETDEWFRNETEKLKDSVLPE